VPREAFARHLATLTSEGRELFVTDLYLAFACRRGLPAGLAAFERELMPRVAAYVARVDARPAFVAEVQQMLRAKLFAAQGDAAIASYAGRAPLAGWLRTVAVRAARELLARDRKLTTLNTSGSRDLRSPDSDPALDLAKRESRAAFDSALVRTLEGLDDRSRVLLRLHFAESLSCAAIGRIYHVHASTVARWLADLRGQLVEALCAELKVGNTELASIVGLVRSRLDVRLATLLQRPRG
jgi:RNA polymerase sigma-70 factor (ECF subfamily)